MKKLFLPLLFFPLLAYCAQGTASASLTAGISLSEIQTMYFSSITVYGNCEIAMSPSGARVVTGEAVLNDEFNAPCRFALKGTPLAMYKVNLPTSTTVTNGSHTLTLKSFTAKPTTGTLGADGRAVVEIGATLVIDGNFSSGVYRGVFDVTANYE